VHNKREGILKKSCLDRCFSPLEQALVRASTGTDLDREEFYKLLLESDLYAPMSPSGASSGEPKGGRRIISGDSDFLYVAKETKTVVPVFSRDEFLDVWADSTSLPKNKFSFNAIIWQIAEDVWLHLNPGQEWGKEFSPWELSELRRGHDAIAEILPELDARQSAPLEAEIAGVEYEEFRKASITSFEIFTEVEEAFLVLRRSDEKDDWLPLIAIFCESLSQDRRSMLGLELVELGSRHMPELVCDRLVVEICAFEEIKPHESLFEILREHFVPFYVAQKKFPIAKSKLSALASQLRKIKKWTRKVC